MKKNQLKYLTKQLFRSLNKLKYDKKEKQRIINSYESTNDGLRSNIEYNEELINEQKQLIETLRQENINQTKHIDDLQKIINDNNFKLPSILNK